MPELPEVETVRRTLQSLVVGKKIEKVEVHYEKIIANETKEAFQKKLVGEVIREIHRKGKWLIFELDHYDLLSHLRMEGKYFLKTNQEPLSKHEHVVFCLDYPQELRYHDTRKFGRMYLFEKGLCMTCEPLQELGYEPWDENLTDSNLYKLLQKKKVPIKTSLLDQSVIAGIGNIYEILFLSHIHPLKFSFQLTKKDCQRIIGATQKILYQAIEMGGTTIRSYESAQGVHGRFQQHLLVHNQTKCPVCQKDIERITVGGRSTYFCPNCQKR